MVKFSAEILHRVSDEEVQAARNNCARFMDGLTDLYHRHGIHGWYTGAFYGGATGFVIGGSAFVPGLSSVNRPTGLTRALSLVPQPCPWWCSAARSGTSPSRLGPW
jgi:hypothetical protein